MQSAEGVGHTDELVWIDIKCFPSNCERVLQVVLSLHVFRSNFVIICRRTRACYMNCPPQVEHPHICDIWGAHSGCYDELYLQ
jgi:hypothetical protein